MNRRCGSGESWEILSKSGADKRVSFEADAMTVEANGNGVQRLGELDGRADEEHGNDDVGSGRMALVVSGRNGVDHVRDLVHRLRGWESPPRLGADWRPAVEEAPLDVLPEPMSRYAREVSGAVGCDPSLALGPMLAIAAGLMGASVRLQMGTHWHAGATVLQANVGWTGEGKGRALSLVAQPAMWQDQALAEGVKSGLATCGVGGGSTAGRDWTSRRRGAAGRAELVAEAVAPSLIVEGGTVGRWIERLGRPSPVQERGVVVWSRDLSRNGMGAQCGRSRSDRQQLMRISEELYRWDAGAGRWEIQPQISITGNVTPDLLRELRNAKRDDGFLERWLFVYPDRWAKPRSGDKVEVSAEGRDGWREMVRRLWWRPYQRRELLRGRIETVAFSAEGRAAFAEGYDRHVDEMNSVELPDDLRGVWARLETYASRFCLILAVLHEVAGMMRNDKWQMANDGEAGNGERQMADDKCQMADGERQMAGSPTVMVTVSADVAMSAWRLVKFFKSHARRVYGALDDSEAQFGPPRGAQLILGWLANHPGRETLSFGDLTRHFSSSHGYDREMLMEGACWLEARQALRAIARDEQGPKKAGRPRAREWRVFWEG
jgi:hypothetical protein